MVEEVNQIQVNQTNTPNIFGKWIPALVTSDLVFDKSKKTLKNGLEVFHPKKIYANHVSMRIITREEWLVMEESIIYNNKIYYKIGENKEYIVRINYNNLNNLLSIELLKPKTTPINAKYHIIIFTLLGKSVGSGSFQESKVVSGEENVI